MKKPVIRLFVIAIMMVATLLLCHDCEACPNCKEALANESDGLQTGYVVSILLMMSAPAFIFVGWGVYIIRELKRQKRQHDSSPQNLTPVETFP